MNDTHQRFNNLKLSQARQICFCPTILSRALAFSIFIASINYDTAPNFQIVYTL